MRKDIFVLDTTALIALRRDEAGADRIHQLMESAREDRCRLLVSFMSRMELLYLVWRKEGERASRQALRLLDSLPLEWVGCEAAILEDAAHLKVRGNLSVADSWIAATALVRRARLVHRDPEFSSLAELDQETLPA